MIPPGLTCARCERPFHGHLARRTDDGYVHARPATTCDRVADLAWMTATGETATGAAERLGIDVKSLWMFCRRAGALDLWNQLADRDPVLASGRINRKAAA